MQYSFGYFSFFILYKSVFIILLIIAVISKIALRYSKFVSNIDFELDANQIATYNQTLNIWKVLDDNQYLRLLMSRVSIKNSRNCCGISNNYQRNFMKITYNTPWYINTNVSVVQLKLKDIKVILFPNLFMVISKSNVEIYNGVFDLIAEDTEFTESVDAVPSNTKIVRYTYLHVNKNGTPDKRFKENPKIPICLYKHITFNTNFGLSFQILCPNIDASTRFVNEYTKSISSKPVSMFYNVSDKYLSVPQLSVLPVISRVLSIKENNNLTWQNVINKIQKIPQWPVKDNSIFDIFAKWIDKMFFGSVHYNVTTEKVMALALITNIFALHKVYAGRKISAVVSWIFILFALITRDWMFLFIFPWLIIDCIRIYFGNYGRLKSNKTFSFTKFKSMFINKQQNIYKAASCGISLFCILLISCFCNYTAPPEQQHDFTQGVTIVSSSDNNIALDYVNSTTNDSSKNIYNAAESTLNSESSNLSTIDEGTTTSMNQVGVKDPTTKKQTTTTKKQTTTTKKRTTTAVPSDQNGQVWVTASGKKYHSNPNCSNMKSPSKITLANAKAKGYTPCKKCYG